MVDGGGFGWSSSQGLVGGFADFAIDFGFEGFDSFLIHHGFADEEQGEFRERVTAGFAFAFFVGLVELFVIRERVRVGARDVCVDQRGAAAFSDVADSFFADGITFKRVGAVAFGDVQAGKISN